MLFFTKTEDELKLIALKCDSGEDQRDPLPCGSSPYQSGSAEKGKGCCRLQGLALGVLVCQAQRLRMYVALYRCWTQHQTHNNRVQCYSSIHGTSSSLVMYNRAKTGTSKSQMAFRLAVTSSNFHFNSMQGTHSALQTLINPHRPVGMQKDYILCHKGKIAPA